MHLEVRKDVRGREYNYLHHEQYGYRISLELALALSDAGVPDRLPGCTPWPSILRRVLIERPRLSVSRKVRALFNEENIR